MVSETQVMPWGVEIVHIGPAHPTDCALLTLDDCGVVADIAGAVERFGLSRGLVGRPLAEAFRGWKDAPAADGATACRFEAATPSGAGVVVEVFRLSRADAGPAALAVFRPKGVPMLALTPRQQQCCALGELSAAVAHEINNALTLLNGWLGLMLSDSAPASPQHSRLGMLVEESERVCMLARNLLEVARSTGAEQEPLDLAAVIADMLCLVRNDMKTSNVRVEERIEPDLPPVLGSRGRLKQALLNLLVNARQAMPKGGQVTLRVERDGDGRVAIRVADTGVGIPPENMERIFEPYFTTKENGTGLGLPVTRRIVEEHGGTLGVTSQAGAGTEFVIRLPVAGR